MSSYNGYNVVSNQPKQGETLAGPSIKKLQIKWKKLHLIIFLLFWTDGNWIQTTNAIPGKFYFVIFYYQKYLNFILLYFFN